METSNQVRRSAQFIIFHFIYFKAFPGNSQASTQILSRGEHNGLQWTSWQRRYFEKKSRFPFEVARTAAETVPSHLDRQ